MRTSLLIVFAALASASCGDRNRAPPPGPQTQGTSLHLGATALSPSVNIGPLDAGGTHLQIGSVQANLPGENSPPRAGETEGN